MLITVYNFKGGEGKSKISSNLAISMNYSIVTNDVYSPIDNIFSDDKIMKLYPKDEMPDFEIGDNIIFDFGGYADGRIISILKKSKWIIVPITNEEDNIQVGINTIDEISKYNKNIIIVVNKTVKGDFEAVKNDLKEIYSYPMFEIKKSTAVVKLSKTGKSISQLAEEGGVFKAHYKKIANQFDILINFINQ